MKYIDLNADLGEGIADDAALLELVTSASIACGGHAGDEGSIRAALKAAKANAVRVGAHPGYADRENFGRVRIALAPEEVIAAVLSQMRLLHDIAAEEGVDVHYVKLHGALANVTSEDIVFARTIFGAIVEIYPDIAIMALAASAQEEAVRALGLPAIRETYADRAYQPSGHLAPRGEPGSVIASPETVIARCTRLAKYGEIEALDGSILRIDTDSICLHGDTPGALRLARSVRPALEAQGVAVRAFEN